MVAGTYQLRLVFHNTAVQLAWQGAGAPSLPLPFPALPFPSPAYLAWSEGRKWEKRDHLKIGKVNLGLNQEKDNEVGA